MDSQTESAAAITDVNTALQAVSALSAVTVDPTTAIVRWDFDVQDEANIDKFVIQSSTDGTHYASLATVDAGQRLYTAGIPLLSSLATMFRITPIKSQFASFTEEHGITSESTPITSNAPLAVALDGAGTSAEGNPYALGLGLQNAGGISSPSEWRVNWGDGSDPDNDGIVGEVVAGDLRAASHAYADNGTYVISVAAPISALGGATATATQTATVSNVVPILTVDGSDAVNAGNDYQITFSAHDPGSDTIATWHVDWGDGTSDDFDSTVSSASHALASTLDTATVAVTATDEDGTYTAAPISVTINPQTPSPLAFIATSSTGGTISWTRRSTRATGYVIEASATADFTEDLHSVSVSADADSALLTNLLAGSTYYVHVGVKHYSTTHFDDQTILISTPNAFGAAPTDLSVASVADGSVGLSWTPSNSSDSLLIERSLDATDTWATIFTAATDTSSYSDGDAITEGHAYRYRLRTTNGLTTSTPGNVVSAIPLANAPDGLSIETTDVSHIHLTWTDNSAVESGFSIERAIPDDGDFTFVANAAANATSFDVSGLNANATYTFRIAATNAAAIPSTWSSQTVTMPANGIVPDAVVLNAADKSGLPSAIQLTWSATANAAQYRIERSEDDVAWTAISTVGTTQQTLTDTTISVNRTYRYRVIGVGALGGESMASNVVTATTALNAPTSLSVAANDTTATLRWTDNSPNEQWFTVWKYTSASGTGEAIATVHLHEGVGVTTYEVPLDSTNATWFAVGANTADATSALTGRVVSNANALKRAKLDVDISRLLNGAHAMLTLNTSGITSPLRWTVNWGDGAPSQVFNSLSGASILDQTHDYPSLPEGVDEQSYDVEATAVDDDGTSYPVTAQTLTVVANAAAVHKASEVDTRRAILEKFNEIYNAVEYEPYVGIMKGAKATGETKRGNDWDQSLLLQDEIKKILAKAGRSGEVTTTLRYDVIQAKWDDIQKWFGVADRASAASIISILEIAADHTSGHWLPRLRTPTTYPDGWWASGDTVAIWHASLELSAGPSGNLFSGSSSIRLDPSWKFHNVRDGTVLFPTSTPLIGTSPET